MKTAFLALILFTSAYGGDTLIERVSLIMRVADLLRENGIRTDYPIKSATYVQERKEWRIEYDDGKPDAAFTVFIADPSSSSFRLRWAGADFEKEYLPKNEN